MCCRSGRRTKWLNSCHGTWISPINSRQYGAHLTLTLQGYSLSPDKLINKVEVIPTAVVALVEFQKNGWIYLRP
ncbi:hypothetical protein B1P48_20775 [Salmonella enterica]|nr:hypothetical protein [Salmonella enterica]EDX2040228.1 hypothetical protein [Salmonella enterica subsp. houtenae serovar 50:z4,z23:-]EAB1814378.1 hypothetical protein [Salmonella enterica]EAM8824194.1 hypothetical protein [Salmonella enterica]EAN0727842.1 hypothetical protein [Salmonella enterica]